MQPQQSSSAPPAGNLVLFFLVAFLVLVGYQQYRSAYAPPPTPKKTEEPAEVKGAKEKQNFRLPTQPEPTGDEKLIALGSEASPLRVLLDPRGAGVRRVTLNRFRSGDIDARPTDDPFDIVPAESNTDEASHLLYHMEGAASRPTDTLGKILWQSKGVEQETVDGVTRQLVRFTATTSGLIFTKTYSLSPGDYHLGLSVTISRPAEEKTKVKFRYQLTGAKGLPVEGKWFTSRFRNSIIALEDDQGNITRDYQELQKILMWGNGNEITTTGNTFLRYAAIETQYFASAIVVANGQDRNFLERARPTIEYGVLYGRVPKGSTIQGIGDRLTVQSHDGRTLETVFIGPKDQHMLDGVTEKSGPVAILYRNLGYDDELKQAPKLAREIRIGRDSEATHALWEGDITLRVTTKPVELEPGKSVTHSYLLYNGPVKPSLLGYLTGEARVEPELVKSYVEDLKLNTMTDFQSPGWFGYVWYHTGVTWLVIKITNLVHFVLSHLYYWIPNLGLCVILLTVLVRALMYPLSRKQALMGLKMQALAPEIKKLSEQHKDDKHAFQMAQWDLFKKHGVSPFGSCWTLLLQMPILMGLWYALQESITFRLAPFWPTWIVNLAAPDMLFYWGRSIPMISNDASYGGFLYLGPYFNILPLVAVVLMLIQQQMMTPPPADEQQEMQQKMMKYMMVFFAILFYKFAAGLSVYYICTTLWGFAERAMLPKATLEPVKVDLATTTQLPANSDKVTSGASGVATSGGGKKNKKKRKDAKELATEPELTGFAKWKQGWADWWQEVLEQARKK